VLMMGMYSVIYRTRYEILV